MTMDSYETLELTRPADGVAVLTLTRPRQRNAITFQMFDEMHDLLAKVRGDADIRCLIVTGEGEGFCAGLDLDDAEALAKMSANEMMLGQEHWAGAFERFHDLPQAVIAAVNGAAAGGGLGLALAADLRIASEKARFNAAFVRIGLSAGDVGVSWSRPRVVGLGHAAEIMLTGDFFDAYEAERIGLVNRVYPAEELMNEALALADRMASNSPFRLTRTRRVLMTNVDAGSLRSAVEVENRGQTLAPRGQDLSESLGAFREKREP